MVIGDDDETYYPVNNGKNVHYLPVILEAKDDTMITYVDFAGNTWKVPAKDGQIELMLTATNDQNFDIELQKNTVTRVNVESVKYTVDVSGCDLSDLGKDEDPTKEPPELLAQGAYDSLEDFYVNYAGGTVSGFTDKRPVPGAPVEEREKLQAGIIKNYGITNPEMHASWITKNKTLGPIFYYLTKRDTKSTLYPAQEITIDGKKFTIGTSKPANETALHYAALSQVDFIDKKPYVSSDSEQKAIVINAVAELVEAINDGYKKVQSQILYSESSFTEGEYPEVVASEQVKNITFESVMEI